MSKPTERDRRPPPKHAATGGLDEVERALSILDGRHPEHHRAMRETAAAVEERRARAEAERAAERSRARRKALVALAGLAVAVAAVVVGSGIVRRARRTAELVTLASAPWEARGWAVVASSGLTSGARLEATVDPGCVVVVTSADALAVERGGARVTGRRSIGWCSCAQERVVATTTLPQGEGGMRVLRIDAGAIGGAKLFASGEPHPQTIAPGGDDCAEAAFDEWLASGKGRAGEPNAGNHPRSARYRVAGFGDDVTAPASAAFLVVAAPADGCTIATSSTPSDRLSLRATGGARVAVGAGALAWCDAKGAIYSVWREGDGEIVARSVPSKKIGGMMGLRELAASVGLVDVVSWVRPADHGADAADALRASFIGDVVASPDGSASAAGAQEKRVVAVSREVDAEIAVTSPPGAYFLCSPSLDIGASHVLCVESSPHTWRPRDTAKVGLAYAPLPFWLSAFASIHEPDALSGALTLLALARRLGTDGFTPTILGSATETATGVEVLGRAGEDAIVAVGLLPKPPWIVPYTNGAAWDLSRDPTIIPLAPFARVALAAKPAPTAPKEARRTVVFRHATPKP